MSRSISLLLAAALAAPAAAQFGLPQAEPAPASSPERGPYPPGPYEEYAAISDSVLINSVVHAIWEVRRSALTIEAREDPVGTLRSVQADLLRRNHLYWRYRHLGSTEPVEHFGRRAWVAGWIQALSEVAASCTAPKYIPLGPDDPVPANFWESPRELGAFGDDAPGMVVLGPRWVQWLPYEYQPEDGVPDRFAEDFRAWGDSMLAAAELTADQVATRLQSLRRLGYQGAGMRRELVTGDAYREAREAGDRLLLDYSGSPSLTALRAYQAILRPYFRVGAYGFFEEGAPQLARYDALEARAEEIAALARGLVLTGPAESPETVAVLPEGIEYPSREDYLAGNHLPERIREARARRGEGIQ